VETVDGALMAEVFAPVEKRPTRALEAPDHADDPALVIERLRRLDTGLEGHTNGHGNGHASSTGAAATKPPSSTGSRASED
jgi:cell division protease FtsH